MLDGSKLVRRRPAISIATGTRARRKAPRTLPTASLKQHDRGTAYYVFESPYHGSLDGIAVTKRYDVWARVAVSGIAEHDIYRSVIPASRVLALPSETRSYIAPSISFVKCDTYWLEHDQPAGSTGRSEVRSAVIADLAGYALEVVVPESRSPYARITIPLHPIHDGEGGLFKSVIELLYEHDCCPRRASDAVGAERIPVLLAASANAYDSDPPSSDEYVFTAKTDGERMWMIKAGYVWLYVRRNLGAAVHLWGYCESPSLWNRSADPVVIDIEYCDDRLPDFIDVLSDSDGISTGQGFRRSLARMHAMLDGGIITRDEIIVRRYYDTFEEASIEVPRLGLKCDGIIAIALSNRDSLKIKDVKSIELAMHEGGTLVASDGTPVASIGPCSFEVGDIIELRLVASGGGFVIKEAFKRHDKARANGIAAILHILSLAAGRGTSDSMIRMTVVRWAREVQSALIRRACEAPSDNAVIIDVGSGDGKMVAAYSSLSSDIKVLFIEPNRDSCRKLATTAGSPVLDAADATNACFRLSSGIKNPRGSPYFVVNATAEEVFDTEFVRGMRKFCKCVVFSLSLNHCIGTAKALAKAGANVAGTGYIYRTKAPGVSMIDGHGIVMRTTETRGIAEVQWGTDTQYTEAALTMADISTLSPSRCIDDIPMNATESSAFCESVASRMYSIRQFHARSERRRV